VTAAWGSTFICNRLVIDDGPPLLFLTIRFGFAALVLIVLARKRKRTPHLVRDSLLVGALLSVGIGFQMLGQVYTTASKAAFVTGLSVPLTPVAAYLLARRKPSAENVLGLVIATLGFACLTWPKGELGVNTGDLLVLVTAVVYSGIFVTMSETARHHDARWYSAGQIAFAALFVGVGRLAMTPF